MRFGIARMKARKVVSEERSYVRKGIGTAEMYSFYLI